MLKKYVLFVTVPLLIAFTLGVLVGKVRKIPFVKRDVVWSIGIYEGDSPFNLKPSAKVTNPVFTAADVSGMSALFVADPFMVKRDNEWYLFFEALAKNSIEADIGYATSADGYHWKYGGIALDEPFHLSYPCVFEYKGDMYMIPEAEASRTVRLYKADPFPSHWKLEHILMDNICLQDPTLFQHDGKWWLFGETGLQDSDVLRLYYADELTGPWVEHPRSPIVAGDANIARPAGNVFSMDGTLYRVAQDCYPVYGGLVRAFEITELTPTTYSEKMVEKPILDASGSGWNAEGMHQVSSHQLGPDHWIAVVDGFERKNFFSLKD